MAILEPLHFPDDLYPLRVEGFKHRGKPYVALNFPAAPADLFHGVANVLDPKELSKAAGFTSAATQLAGAVGCSTGVHRQPGLESPPL